MCSKKFTHYKNRMKGPAVDVMAMSLDSHVVDHVLCPGLSGLNSRRARVRVCPRSRENGGKGIAAWPSPLGVISRFLSLSVFLASTHAL